MRISTLPLFLMGKRRAIEAVAASRLAPVCGVLFVLSAGLAREYDGEDLVHEPWHALLPLLASLVAATFLFVYVRSVVGIHRVTSTEPAPNDIADYGSFLGLFLMTAPLAWLYAVPYEHFLSPLAALTFNLYTLALVSLWRVLLISRVISVVYNLRFVQALFVVMLYANVVAFLVMLLMPKPVIAVMGGIRYTDVERLTLDISYNVMSLTVVSFPVWLIGAVICLRYIPKTWPPRGETSGKSGGWGLCVFAFISILAWAPALWVCQPDQIRRREAERLLMSGDVSEALRIMSLHGPDQYPPHWDPPPRMGYGEHEPGIDKLIEVMRSDWPADWVADIYIDKVRRATKQRMIHLRWGYDWSDLPDTLDERDLKHIHEADVDKLAFLLEHDSTLSDTDREVITRLMELARAEQQKDKANGLPGPTE